MTANLKALPAKRNNAKQKQELAQKATEMQDANATLARKLHEAEVLRRLEATKAAEARRQQEAESAARAQQVQDMPERRLERALPRLHWLRLHLHAQPPRS
eukprot:SAG22_NODE_2738_length_2261_cov_2.822849_2_plen_101_part_00